ncbi:MAG TPA: inositol monophosphatase family protein [Chitinophagaceae bacterium]|nr:inositol monophosphatase [Chitinophagaceae bacterium]HNF29030.1 inositol monophosphatase family protein [Chitinophagaceae bacterium]HNL82208.1 inositol monophosphatase family protein [Chitinophagaceae bacterium]HNM35321.1 inositol monophosphatase family protein [Chitinophagaceae bacterium]HNN32060.1 inositol monophosphatase family protein [Chitinophagaceae bacterium]
MLKSTLLKAVEDGAKILKEYFDKQFVISNKEGINNLVTEVDHKSEQAIINCIKNSFPNHFILSEEVGEIVQDSEYKWIIDPIDGTVNYANGIPICCVSIGIEKKDEMIMGAVYNPFMNEFYFAEKNNGAFLNNHKIKVSHKTDILSSCLVTGFPYTYLDATNGPLQIFEKFIRKGIPVRRLGSAAIDLCWVAAGRFDGFYEHKLSAWDSAAGFIIVEEAGGKVTNLNGDFYSPYQPGIIATNGKIHDEMVRIVNGGSL